MVSVVIPVYNGAQVLPRTVPAVLAMTDVDEMVWVDDGSTDGTRDVLAALVAGHPGARHIRFASNRGRSAARNAGVAATEHEVVVFLDADVEPALGTARALAAPLGDAGAIASVARQIPVPSDPSDAYQDYAVHHPRGPSPHAAPGDVVDWKYFVTGACAVRREAFERAGGFPEAVRYGEDIAIRRELARDHPSGLRLADASVRVHDLDTLAGALGKFAALGPRLPDLGLTTNRQVLGALRRIAAMLAPARAPVVRLVDRSKPSPLRRWATRWLLAHALLDAGDES